MVIREPTAPIQTSLDNIAGLLIPAMFRRFHLNRDVIIGLVGERGTGKSLGGSNIILRDYGMSGEPMWSNMAINMGLNIPDDVAGQFGIDGGVVQYGTEFLDKQAFLSLDERYSGGCFFFDEFNLEYGEARRSSANVNLMTDRAIQQLRHIESGMIYTVINENYVDVRIRENTDIFVRCTDVAFKHENLKRSMKQGVIFEWTVYAMSARVAGEGNTYNQTGKPIGPFRIVLDDLHGVYDTLEIQARGNTKYSQVKQLTKDIDIREDPKTVAHRNEWGWLDDRLNGFWKIHKSDGETLIMTSAEWAHELNVSKDDWPVVAKKLEQRIPDLYNDGKSGWRTRKYHIPNSNLVTV